MSTESAEGDTTAEEDGGEPPLHHEPGPATVEAILDDLRDAEIAVSEYPTHDLTTVDVADLVVRARLPQTDVVVRSPEDLDLTPTASAWVTDYRDADGGVALSITAEGDDSEKCRTSSCAELEVDEARDLALQLLASAAVADDSTDGPEGYLVE